MIEDDTMARQSAMDLALKLSLEQILLELQPDQVPVAYLEQAVVEMADGSIKTYDSKAYKRLLNAMNKNPKKKSQIVGARVMFNLTDAKLDIKSITNSIFSNFVLDKPVVAKKTRAKGSNPSKAPKITKKPVAKKRPLKK
jgi:hypothetical protein